MLVANEVRRTKKKCVIVKKAYMTQLGEISTPYVGQIMIM